MAPRTALLTAIVLLLIQGLSGVLVGLSLLGAGIAAAGSTTGLAIAGGMLVYGLILTISGIAIVFGRRWAGFVAAAALIAGLALLAGIALLVGPDLVVLSGVVIWGVTLACLYAARATAL